MRYSEIVGMVPNMSHSQLNALIKLSTEELDRRAEKCKEVRTNWINKMYNAYFSHPNVSSRVRGKLIIVAAYDYYTGTRIGTAFPINGDTFDEKTGIAVAFAKAIGEPVPDFV